ncbi:hypothetical protein [Haliangium sp.]|uniref:hypothetical protein n=1 Tax=Haliangium sp. TaxID=2663208 RepID=UPI003D112145
MSNRAPTVPLAALLFAVSGLLAPSPAPAQSRAGVAETDADVGERVRAGLDRVASARSSDERLAAATEVASLGPAAIPALRAFLARPRQSSDAERRAVLTEIRADVPDEDGRFARARRGKKPEVRTSDDFDWLAELAALSPPPTRAGEVMADVAALRALAATRATEAAEAIIEFAFDEVGIVYRDECGRTLRQMAPYSLPALIAVSNDRARRAMARYATYQLERLDRKSPAKAIDEASVDEDLAVAVFEAYAAAKPREAVGPILATTDDSSPRVRKAARAAWMAYVTGPEPPPAPKRRLKLAGGRMTDEPEPLWLNYRELADIELRRVYEEVMGTKAPRRDSLESISRALFGHYDQVRAEALAARYRDAAKLAEAGDWAAATTAYDRILARDPEHPERAAMAPAYLEHAKLLEAAGSWREAAAAYSKAHGLAPDAPGADQALAAHHAALGKALEAEGKDGSLALGRAHGIDPETARRTAAGGSGGASVGPPRWMMYAGVGALAGALLLLFLGVVARQRGRRSAA